MKVGQAFPSKYLTAADLDGRTRKVVIERYEMEEIGEEKREKPVLYFEGKGKALVLNTTNANLIAEVLDTDEMDDWIGREVSLYPTRVDFRGKRVEAIRVKADAPPPPAEEEPGGVTDDDDVPF